MEHQQSDLANAIRNRAFSEFNEDHIKVTLYNLLCGVRYLHSANIIHRDIKPGNILINEACHVQLADFGISRTMPESLTCKGSGNTSRIRDYILRNELT